MSEDLYNWETKPIALFPNSGGYCFSGSALVDENNISGLGTKDNPPLLLFYTLHRGDTDDDKEEEQALAYSTDGVTFHNFPSNPILANQGTPDFRDPKVFFHKSSNQWLMSLAVFDRVEFYTSQNLIDWQFLSKFSSDASSAQGLWECPDLFPIEFEGEVYWVLIVSYGLEESEGRSLTRYFIGTFDGNEFQPIVDEAYNMDEGSDYYAGVSFSNPGEELLTMGWANNWGYAEATAASDAPFCGQLSSARSHFLYRDLDGKLRLGSKPCLPPRENILETKDLKGSLNLESSAFFCELAINEGGKPALVTLENEHGEKVVITLAGDGSLTVDRTHAGHMDEHHMLKKELYQKRSMPAQSDSPGKLTFLFDQNLLEVFGDDGRQVITMLLFPSEDFSKIICENVSGTLQVLGNSRKKMADNLFVNQDLFS